VCIYYIYIYIEYSVWNIYQCVFCVLCFVFCVFRNGKICFCLDGVCVCVCVFDWVFWVIFFVSLLRHTVFTVHNSTHNRNLKNVTGTIQVHWYVVVGVHTDYCSDSSLEDNFTFGMQVN